MLLLGSRRGRRLRGWRSGMRAERDQLLLDACRFSLGQREEYAVVRAVLVVILDGQRVELLARDQAHRASSTKRYAHLCDCEWQTTHLLAVRTGDNVIDRRGSDIPLHLAAFEVQLRIGD